MEVGHIEDNDSDYFSFSNLSEAVKFIEEEDIRDFELTDNPKLPASEYTFVK